MSTWSGTNWQLVDRDDDYDVIGATWGVGLLDEQVAHTGTLGTVMAALRAELSRPVELGPGRTGVPEVFIELDSDTVSLHLRGPQEVVRAAWERLPRLFVPATVSDEVSPARGPGQVWVSDLVHRAGRNALSLSWLGPSAADVTALARARIASLDPGRDETAVVFFTTSESLVGTTYPVRESPLPAGPPSWADGTPRWLRAHGDPGAAGSSDDGHAPVRFVEDDSPFLLSCLVPRDSSGIAAAQIVRAQLEAAFQQTLGSAPQVRLAVHGMGEGLWVVAHTEPETEGSVRARVLEDFSRRLTVVPDTWLAGASEARLSAWAERERAARGLGPEEEVSADRVHRALRDAASTLHIATPASPPRAGGKGTAGTAPTPFEQGFPAVRSAPSTKGLRRFAVRPPLGKASHPFLTVTDVGVGDGVIATAQRTPAPGGGALRWLPVDLTRPLAVFEDGAGVLTIVDAAARYVRFHPGLFRRPARLRAALDARLAGTPRLSIDSDVTEEHVRAMRRRSRAHAISRAAVPAALVVALLCLALFRIAEAAGRGPVFGSWTDLDDGTRLYVGTPWAGAAASPGHGELVGVTVELCGPEDTVRAVTRSSFRLRDASDDAGLTPVPIGAEPDFAQVAESSDGCAYGELAFERGDAERVRLEYASPSGAEHRWGPEKLDRP